MKSFFIFCLLFISATLSAQFTDKILINNVWQELYSKPLYQYFERYPDKKPQHLAEPFGKCNYDASFEIVDGKLRLKDITISKDDNDYDRSRSIYKELFGEADLNCDFFTGLLLITNDKAKMNEDDGSYHQVIEIRNGKVVKSKILNREEYEKLNERQYVAYKKTETYQKEMAFYKKLRLDIVGEKEYNENKAKEEELIQGLSQWYWEYYTWIIVPF